MNNTMVKQIRKAKKHVRALKKHAPYLFDEYTELQTAQVQFDVAKQRLSDAKKRWMSLGEE